MDFGGGLVEVRCVLLQGSAPTRRVCRDDTPERSAENKVRSWRRARTSMRRRLWALKPVTFATFTKRGTFSTFVELHECWRRFARSCADRFDGFAYVAVPEPHANGGWHMHCALNARYDVTELRLLWHRALGAKRIREPLRGDRSPGNVQVEACRGSLDRLTAYMAKYLSKSMSDREARSYAYYASRGLVPVNVERWIEPLDLDGVPIWRLLRWAEARYGLQFSFYEWKEGPLTGFTLKSRS